MKRKEKKKFFNSGTLLSTILAVAGIILFFYSWQIYQSLKNTNSVILILLSVMMLLFFFYKYNRSYVGDFYIFEYKYPSLKNIFLYTCLAIISFLACYFVFWRGWIFFLLLFCFLFFYFITRIVEISKVKCIKMTNDIHTKKANQIKIMDLIKIPIFLFLILLLWQLLFEGLVTYAFLLLFLVALIQGDFFNKKSFIDDVASKRFSKNEKILLVIITIAAILLRFYKIDDLPPGFDNDVRTKFQYLLFNIGQGNPIETFTMYGGSSYGTFDYYLTYLFLNLFGFDMMNMRLLAVLMSLLSIVFFFLLARELYGKSVAIMAAMLFSTMFICISFSRHEEFVYRTVLYLNAGLFFLIRAIKTGKISFFLLAGIFVVFNFYTYQAGKIHLPILFIAFCTYAFDFFRIKESMKNFIILMIVFIVILLMLTPLLSEIIKRPDQYFEFYNHYKINSQGSILSELFRQFTIVAKSFIIEGTKGFVLVLPNRPLLIGVEQLLFIAGISYLLYAFKQRSNIIVISWLLLGSFPIIFFPYVFELYYYRMIHVIPSMTLVIALGFNVIYRYISELLPEKKRVVYNILFVVTFIFVLYNTYRYYFIEFANDKIVRDRYQHVNFLIEKEIKKIAPKSKVFVSKYFDKVKYSLFFGQNAFYKKGEMLFTLIDPSNLKIADIYNSEKDIVIISEGFYADYFEYLKEYFPNIKIDKKQNILNEEMLVDPYTPQWLYVVVTIPIKDIKNAYGLNVKAYNSGGLVKEGIYPSGKNDISGEKLVFFGIIELPENTRYIFDAGPDIKIKTIINGRLYKDEKLPKGPHKIEIVLDDVKGIIPDIFWTYNGNREVIPEKYILRARNIYGVCGNYKCISDLKNTLSQIEPIMLARLYWFSPKIQCQDKDNNYKITWRGYYFAEKDGDYIFELESYKSFRNELRIAENLCNVNLKEGNYIYPVNLKKGWNEIKVFSESFFNKSDAAAFFYRLKVQKPGDKEPKVIKYYEIKPYKP